MSILKMEQVKRKFRILYGVISVQELLSNIELVQKIKEIESKYFFQVSETSSTTSLCGCEQ